MRVIIIDDEPKAITLLEGYLHHFDTVEVVATFRNALKALQYIQGHEVELLFLDINMPHLSGLSFSRMLPESIKIVFTTAYAEHALESYEVNAVDYLLKPISLERFSRTMAKVLTLESSEQLSVTPSIILKSGTKIYRVVIEEVLYLEKDGNYIYYHFAEQRIMARQTVVEALGLLGDAFIQVHKSYVVNTKKIDFIDGHIVRVSGQDVPVSVSYKGRLMATVHKG